MKLFANFNRYKISKSEIEGEIKNTGTSLSIACIDIKLWEVKESHTKPHNKFEIKEKNLSVEALSNNAA